MEKIASGDILINPLQVLKTANIGYGEIVADMGTGAQGHFALQAARIVGDRGTVYAIDILKPVLQNIASRAKLAGLNNIKIIWSNLEVVGGAKEIRDHSADTALLINVLHQTSEHRENIFKEAKRILKRGGRLVVVDWKKKGTPMGPLQHLRKTQEEIQNILISQGFKIQSTFEPGDHHWGIIATT